MKTHQYIVEKYTRDPGYYIHNRREAIAVVEAKNKQEAKEVDHYFVSPLSSVPDLTWLKHTKKRIFVEHDWCIRVIPYSRRRKGDLEEIEQFQISLQQPNDEEELP